MCRKELTRVSLTIAFTRAEEYLKTETSSKYPLRRGQDFLETRDVSGDIPCAARRQGWYGAEVLEERAGGYIDLDVRQSKEVIKDACWWLRPIVKHKEVNPGLASV